MSLPARRSHQLDTQVTPPSMELDSLKPYSKLFLATRIIVLCAFSFRKRNLLGETKQFSSVSLKIAWQLMVVNASTHVHVAQKNPCSGNKSVTVSAQKPAYLHIHIHACLINNVYHVLIPYQEYIRKSI